MLAGAHAGYLIATGIWPIAHRRSFEHVTGPKHDFWLVRVVGGLVAVAGIALGVAVARGRRSPEIQAVAGGSRLLRRRCLGGEEPVADLLRRPRAAGSVRPRVVPALVTSTRRGS